MKRSVPLLSLAVLVLAGAAYAGLPEPMSLNARPVEQHLTHLLRRGREKPLPSSRLEGSSPFRPSHLVRAGRERPAPINKLGGEPPFRPSHLLRGER